MDTLIIKTHFSTEAAIVDHKLFAHRSRYIMGRPVQGTLDCRRRIIGIRFFSEPVSVYTIVQDSLVTTTMLRWAKTRAL